MFFHQSLKSAPIREYLETYRAKSAEQVEEVVQKMDAEVNKLGQSLMEKVKEHAEVRG